MTTSVENRIDEWIARVKKHDAIRTFAFIPAYPAHKTPHPITKYTVAVTDREVKVRRFFLGNRIGIRQRGRLCQVSLCLRVYAPENSSGSSLLRASALLLNAMEAEDNERMIFGLTLSGIGYDTAARTEFRDIIVQLDIIQGEDTDG